MTPQAWARGLARDLTAFLLPQGCAGCGRAGASSRFLCRSCRVAIPQLSVSLCTRCLAEQREPAGCLRHPGYAVRAAWLYVPAAERAVHALKYEERIDLARWLGREMARVLPPGYRPDLVVEVPLHPARRRERGYNQAGLLADIVAARLGSTRAPGLLARLRPTPPQARLGPRERRSNVAGAFEVLRAKSVAGRTVLIVDDVVTTGATLAACAARLRAAGAATSALTLAWAQ
jgi:ComF family protein